MKSSIAYICPECGSAMITVSTLAGMQAKCEACKWSGDNPIAVPFGNPFLDENATFSNFTNELINEYARVAVLPLGKLFVRWGFISTDKQGKPSVKELAAYIKAAAMAIVRSAIETRTKIELERAEKDVRSVS